MEDLYLLIPWMTDDIYMKADLFVADLNNETNAALQRDYKYWKDYFP
jgi:hypothetical protein